jgi:hypothetical protein
MEKKSFGCSFGLTEELYKIVLISPSLTWSKGSMLLTPLLNSSWNTKLILAPPESSFSERSLVLPSIVVRNSDVNSVMTDRTIFPELPSPRGPPRERSSAVNFCWFAEIRDLMSGNEARMWCMRIYQIVSLNNQFGGKACTHHIQLPRQERCPAKLCFALV